MSLYEVIVPYTVRGLKSGFGIEFVGYPALRLSFAHGRISHFLGGNRENLPHGIPGPGFEMPSVQIYQKMKHVRDGWAGSR
jgi:hypothetical protein